MERRQFIKASCGFCLMMAISSAIPSFVLAADKRKPYKTELNDQNQAIIPLALFAEDNLQIVRIKGSFYDIALHKEEDGHFTAMLMKCTHMDNQLYLTGEGFRCSQHGSEFDKNGAVTKGPAEVSLTRYETSVKDDSIIINIPHEEN